MLARRSLGCLTGCLTRLLLLLVAGVVLFVAIDYVFAPWAFYLGGRFHPYPGWQGIGTMHADAGDYVLYVWITPQPSGRGSLIHLPYLRGWGSLCTPKGERFPMRLSAGMNAHPGRDTNGLEVNMDMYYRPWNYMFRSDDRPRLQLRGRWQNPDLVMDDRGTLSRAFLPDASVYRGPRRNQPASRQTLPIVLHEVPWTTWFGDCRAR